MTHAISVLIVEREPLFRRGLVDCLGNDKEFTIVGAVDTASAGYQLAEDTSPDVTLVGTTLTNVLGLGFVAEIRRRHPSMAVVVVSAEGSDDELFAAIRAGAAAYCGRNIDEAELHELVQRMAAGEYVINEQVLSRPCVAARVLEQFRIDASRHPLVADAFMPLSERELEILGKVRDGLTNAEIGYALGISIQTVKNHVTSIMRKLAVNDRTQAVVTALKRGWLTMEDQSGPNGEELLGVTSLSPSRFDAQQIHG